MEAVRSKSEIKENHIKMLEIKLFYLNLNLNLR